MNNTSRKSSYHHGDLRQCLIDCACDHLRRDSADRLSLRALAREAGVSQTAPYRHFPSKSALFAAIATYGFDLLTEHLLAAAARHPDDVEKAMVAVGLAYVEWAQEHPEKYQMCLDSSLVDFGAHDDLHEAGSRCFEVLLDLIRKGQAEGVFLDKPPETLAGILWASVHGHANLMRKADDDSMKVREDDSVVKALRALVEDRRDAVELFIASIRVR